jgi:hypothetical protein
MRALNTSELLQAHDDCRHHHPIDAALSILRLALPESPWEELAHMPLGQRDRILLLTHAATFGNQLDLWSECPACHATIAIAPSVDNLILRDPDPQAVANIACLKIGGRSFQLRPIDSIDLAAMLTQRDIAQARRLLVERCLSAQDDELAPGEIILDSETVDAAAERLALIDPQADLYFDLSCLACNGTWQAPLDVAALIAAEVRSHAEHLFDQIHEIARAYHWREADILALSPIRRQTYLSRIWA